MSSFGWNCQVCGKRVYVFDECTLYGDRLCWDCYAWAVDEPGKALGLPWNRKRNPTSSERREIFLRKNPRLRRRREFRRRLEAAVARDEVNDETPLLDWLARRTPGEVARGALPPRAVLWGY